MGDASPALTSFNAGILDAKVGGRIDLDRYGTGCLTLDNFLPEVEGPVSKRPGTKYQAPLKYDEREARLISFEFSTEQAYVLEFGDLYMRVHRNQSTVLDSAAGKTASIASITAANPMVVTTTAAHSFSSGEHVYIVDSDIPELNGSFWRVGTTGASTFEINLDGTTLTAQTVAGGTAQAVYEIASPYLATELCTIKTAPSLDELYLACPTKALRKVTRVADDDFTLTEIWTAATLQDPDNDQFHNWPPFAPFNETTTTLTYASNAAPGLSTTVTASVSLFVTTDVGRWLKFSEDGSSSDVGFGEITAYISPTQVTLTVMSLLDASGVAVLPTKNWAWGAFDDVNGHPRAIAFYEDRLFVAAPDWLLQTWWASVSGAFENFRPYSDSGTASPDHRTIAADSAIFNTVNSDRQNAIEWLHGQDTLFMGTRGGEFTIEGADIEKGIQPGNLFVKKRANYGSRANVIAVAVDTVVMFVQRAGRKIKELTYRADTEQFSAPDMNRLAREAVFGRVKYMAYQQEPSRILWCVQEDGKLASFTYEREEGVTAWASHSIGGASDFVESLCVIPSPTDDEDEVWLVVRRTFDGTTTRSIELMNDYWDRLQDVEDAIFMDSTLSFENSETTAQTAAITYTFGTPVNNFVYASGHSFTSGQRIECTSNPENTALVGKQYLVNPVVVAGVSFTLDDLLGSVILTEDEMPGDGSKFRLTTTELTGAAHLAGQTVGVLSGGKVESDVTVSATGKITFPFHTGQAHVGHKYEARLRTMRVEGGAQDGTAQGKPGLFKRAVLRLDQTGRGLYIGTNFDDVSDAVMDYIEWGDPNRSMDAPESLFDGDTDRITFPSTIESDKTIALKHIEPLPCTIVAIWPKIQTQDD